MKTKVIAIANQKGGVGKTTTSVNLSAAIAECGHATLLLDIDPQGNASSALGMETGEDGSLYEAMIGQRPMIELIRETRLPNLFGIPADLDLAGAEIEVARMDGHLGQLRSVLQPVRDSGRFEFIILDCPPSLGILMTNALTASDQILIPIQCEYYALEGLGKLLNTIKIIEKTIITNIQIATIFIIVLFFVNSLSSKLSRHLFIFILSISYFSSIISISLYPIIIYIIIFIKNNNYYCVIALN